MFFNLNFKNCYCLFFLLNMDTESWPAIFPKKVLKEKLSKIYTSNHEIFENYP